MKKRTMGLLLVMGMMLTVSGCGKQAEEAESDGVENVETAGEAVEDVDIKKAAVFFSGQESAETSYKREMFIDGLQEKGHEVIVSFADHDENVQVTQIQEALSQNVDICVIEPVDAYGLSDVLKMAGEQEIPVLSYRELIMESEDVSYFVTYSYRELGQMAGEAIKKEKDLDAAEKDQKSYNIEFLMGSQDSLEALFFYNGVLEVLQPYFESGVLICPSGRNDFDSNGILRWDGTQAKLRFEEILGTFYQEQTPDIICTGFDAAALAVVEVLEEHGMEASGENWPMITGVGCETAGIEAVEQGKMYGSIYMDEQLLAETCVNMLDAYMKGEEVEINDSVQYDNGIKIVETNVCKAEFITTENVNKKGEEVSENTEEEETDTDEALDALSVDNM